MPVKHTYGDQGTAVLYTTDATTGAPVRAISVGGNQSVAVPPPTSGGLLIKKILATADTNIAVISNRASQVFGIELANNAAYAVFLKLFNKSTAPVPGTDTPVWTVQIPAGQRVEINRPSGVEFTLGVGMAATKLVADLDTTALVAADLVGAVFYK